MKKILLALLLTGTAYAGQATIHEIHPTISTSVHVTQTQLDNSALPIPSAVLDGGGTAILRSVVVVDNSGKRAPMKIRLYENKPVLLSQDGQTLNITNAAASTAKPLGIVNVAASDYDLDGLGQRAVATVRSINLPIRAGVKAGTQGTTVYALLEANSTVTYTNNNDLTIKFGIEQKR